MKNTEYAVIGGDGRMAVLAKMLEREGDCRLFLNGGATFPEKRDLEDARAVILPVPCSFDGVHLNCTADAPPLTDITSLIGEGTVLFGGRLPEGVKELCAARKIPCHDLLEDEALLLENAALTAEGALEILLRELPRSIRGAEVLVFGFGRIGQALARCLVPLGAQVSVAARSDSQLSLARCMGCTSLHLSDASLCKRIGSVPWDAAINTVPARIFGLGLLKALPEGMPYVELASGGGVSEAEATLHGIRRINAPGLPGRTAPESAAKIIYERITDLIKRQI